VLLRIVGISIGDFPIGDITLKGILMPPALASAVVDSHAAEEGDVPLAVAEDEGGAGGNIHWYRKFQFLA
jgi:hypothetical protein